VRSLLVCAGDFLKDGNRQRELVDSLEAAYLELASDIELFVYL
jgi:hypothetical protein